MNSIRFICVITSDLNDTHAPALAMDFALAATSFGHHAQLIFTDEGFSHLLHAREHSPQWSKYISNLELYDLAPIWVYQSPLAFSETLKPKRNDGKAKVPDISWPENWTVEHMNTEQFTQTVLPPNQLKFF